MRPKIDGIIPINQIAVSYGQPIDDKMIIIIHD